MKKELLQTARDLIYLVSNAVNQTKPDHERVRKMDLDALYAFAKKHSLLCICAYALEDAGIKDESFSEGKAKAIRKAALFDIEREKVIRELKKRGIWHMPLKGSVLKAYYPRFGMREMSDVDILCDPDRTSDVKEMMESLSYECVHYGTGTDDAYFKPPTLNFEMHHCLFDNNENQLLSDYYADVKTRLLKDENSSFSFCFSDEDFYLYHLAHEYKHLLFAGVGLRPLVDLYLFIRSKDQLLNKQYIQQELKKLNLIDFESVNRSYALELFSTGELSDATAEALSNMLESGAYGTASVRDYNYLYKRLGGSDSAFAKFKYFLGRYFIHGEDLKDNYPFFYKHPYLLPILYLSRPFKGLIRIRSVAKETKRVIDFDATDDPEEILNINR